MAITRTISTCRTCSARIVWCVSEATGNRMPVDADPVAGGNLRMTRNPIPSVHVEPQLSLFDDDDDQLRYVSHFVTCPDAHLWRAERAHAQSR